MNITTNHINKLVQFRKNINQPKFEKIFPDKIVSHLWEKFDNICNRDVIDFYIRLDDDNRDLLVDYLNNYC